MRHAKAHTTLAAQFTTSIRHFILAGIALVQEYRISVALQRLSTDHEAAIRQLKRMDRDRVLRFIDQRIHTLADLQAKIRNSDYLDDDRDIPVAPITGQLNVLLDARDVVAQS